MKQIKLYIGDYQADIDKEVSISLVFNLEDLNNPTNITTGYSRTISLKGTKQNNLIFGDYWKLDKFIAQHSGNPSLGADYDPSKRVSSKIFQDGDLIANGYIKLDSISRLRNEITYNITFYDEIANFFYNLKYKDDGSTRTLADLQYFIKLDNTVLPKETEFNFKINKDIVSRCLLNDYSDDNDQLTDFLTFVPLYQGVYEDFDNQTVLINTNGDDLFPKTFTDSGVEYSASNGYLLGKLNNEYTEWETRDLRSYKQHPALKLNKLIQTICRKENSGYDVELDPEFFNNRNPYWRDGFVLLPLLGTNSESNDDNKITKSLTDGSFNLSTSSKNIEILNPLSDTSSYPYTANTIINLDINIALNANSSADKLYLCTGFRDATLRREVSSLCYQIVAYNEDNQIVGYSDLYNFSSRGTLGGNDPTFHNPRYTPVVSDCAVRNIPGLFYKTGDKYYFKDDDLNNTFKLECKTNKTANKITIKLYSWWTSENNYVDVGEVFTSPEISSFEDRSQYVVSGCTSDLIYTGEVSVNWYSNIVSGSLITKDLLLKNEKSVCDYLLSFTKLFGLYFLYDNERVKILARESFFTGNVVNLEDRIDYSKDLTITPILFDKKFYRMKLEYPDTEHYKKYKAQYDQVYAQQRIDTGYNFNSEINDLCDNLIYNGTIPVLGSDKYFRNFYYKNKWIPSYYIDNMDVSYYKDGESAENSIIGQYDKYTEFGRTPGSDIFPKIELQTADKALSDITSSLVLYNGRKSLLDSKNETVKYWITDDLIEMGNLNENTNCWLYTKSSQDIQGNEIAIQLYELPQFLPVQLDGNNNVIASLDLGYPKEIYLNANYSDSKTLYSQYWKNFYNDQLNVNTKKINCFVRLDYAKQEMLRDFYWFDNAYWIINKIDYNPTSYDTTSVEFIKVWDLDNYR